MRKPVLIGEDADVECKGLMIIKGGGGHVKINVCVREREVERDRESGGEGEGGREEGRAHQGKRAPKC